MTPAELAALLREAAEKIREYAVFEDNKGWGHVCDQCHENHRDPDQIQHADGCIVTRLRKAADDYEREIQGVSDLICYGQGKALLADRLLIALADAIRRPMGVVPDSAMGFVTDADLDAAEKRRPAEGVEKR
jgi:hypothetical protein